MSITTSKRYQHIFSNCRRILGLKAWDKVLAALDNDADPQTLPDKLVSLKEVFHLPDYIDDLARLEWIWHKTSADNIQCGEPPDKLTINPTLSLVPVAWKNIASIIADDQKNNADPEPGESPIYVIIWRHPETNTIHIREASDIDLLAMKIVVEEMDPRMAAETGGTRVAAISTALKKAADHGILLAPPSRIRRDISSVPLPLEVVEQFESTDTFTLQWHITQACDLHCKHCYDRSDRDSMPYETARSVLEDFYDFCSRMNVGGQVTFTGGNPLLYPHFFKIYQEASDKGFGVAILGNPTPKDKIKKLSEITAPNFFQISLEGLEEHNDYIRGPGHFKRSLAFLDLLREMDIYAMVMLTLTNDNLEQVLPLGELLAGRADYFTFNRLSAVGEGKQLVLPKKERFACFLKEYEAAAKQNPILGLKDNLINIVLNEKETDLFGGCTGYGCGAAFNFISLLPDGEVHACRKFPSPIGNTGNDSLFDIYHSDLARKYREGSDGCRKCRLNLVCRGCLAVTYSHGLDVFNDVDPFCFLSETGV